MAITNIGSVQPFNSSQSYDSDTLKAKLAAMAKGQSISAAASNSSDDEEKETRIVTRTQSDGSQIIMVMQGDEVISERKVGGDSDSKNKVSTSVNTQILSGNSQISYNRDDAQISQYEAGNAIASGLVFNSAV